MSCEHNRFVGVVDLGDRVPIEGGGTTVIMLHVCPEPCKGAVPFPAYNFGLLADKTVEKIETGLKEQGIHLVTEQI